MKLAIPGGFNQAHWLQLRLGIPEALALKWFKDWASTNSMQAHDTPEGRHYLVTYPKIQADWPVQFPSKKSAKQAFDHLCGRFRFQGASQDRLISYPPEVYPLHRIIVNGNLPFYRFNSQVIQDLTDHGGPSPMVKLISGEGLPLNHKVEKAQARPLKPIMVEIVQGLLAIPDYTGEGNLFSSIFSGDPAKYTKSIGLVSTHIHEIFEGRFLRGKDIAGWFLEKYGISRDSVSRVLQGVKGSWPLTFALVRRAARNYRHCWDPAQEPADKTKLSCNLAEFIFKETSKGGLSMMLATLQDRTQRISTTIAHDSVRDTLPEAWVTLASQIQQSTWEPLEFWTAIARVYDWGIACWENYAGLAEAHDKYTYPPHAARTYWLGSESTLISWFKKYLEFLQDLTKNDIKISNLGIGNKTWLYFLSQASEAHDLSPVALKGIKI